MFEVRQNLKTTIRKLLECRKEIFDQAEHLDNIMSSIYKSFTPQTTGKVVQHFYSNHSDFSFFKVWDIQKRNIVHDQEQADEIYALTDSEQDSH